MTIQSEHFGFLPDGREVKSYTLSNANGMRVELISFGAIVRSIVVPDRNGNLDDIVLGWKTLDEYRVNEPYLGATVGRYANRIKNALFTLDGNTYPLPANQSPNHLHGGYEGFHKKLWHAEIQGNKIVFFYLSEDGEEGYPGNLKNEVSYSLGDDNTFLIEFNATSDKPTICNLTHHSYFNLAGEGRSDILDHRLMIAADRLSLIDEQQVHMVDSIAVENTPFDFTSEHAIGERIDDEHEQIKIGFGYDHNWILNEPGNKERAQARVFDSRSGRVMEVFTTQPGIQLYTANFLEESMLGKSGKAYPRRSAFCLEPQHFPGAEAGRCKPCNPLYPGEEYRQSINFKFSVQK